MPHATRVSKDPFTAFQPPPIVVKSGWLGDRGGSHLEQTIAYGYELLERWNRLGAARSNDPDTPVRCVLDRFHHRGVTDIRESDAISP